MKTLISAFLIIRLESLNLSITWEDILTAWLRRPVIEIVIELPSTTRRLVERINTVYPF